MTILKEKEIIIPPKCFIQSKNNNKYVYAYIDFYRNDDKKPRNHSICIGKQIGDTNMMNPNNNYYSHFGIPKDFEDYQVFKAGYSWIVEQCFAETGLEKILVEVFGNERAQSIKIISSYIIHGGTSMDYVDNFYGRTLF